jgi:nucleoside-diphosphate-sugar epimerase
MSKRGLTVAVTGPTGELGRAFLRALEAEPKVGRVIGMARRPFDPSPLKKIEYRRGDVLNLDDVNDLVAEADVLVHLAFIILGGRDETRAINLTGSRNVFRAANHVKRLVYTSSVAAYGFHSDNPQPLTEDVRPRGSERFYYSAQKAELERVLDEEVHDTDAYVLRPCIVAGPDAQLLLRELPQNRLPGPSLPLMLNPGTPFQLVHHDDVAQALVAATLGKGSPGAYNLAGEGTVTFADLAKALGWLSLPVPRPLLGVASLGASLPLVPSLAQWVNAARVPVVMDTTKARTELGWKPRYSSRETLTELVTRDRAR